MSYTIKVLSESELIQANVLYRKVYGKERPDNFFTWEFLNGPAGKAIYVGAFDDDKLIGTQAAIPLFFVGDGGKLMLTAKSEDTLLDPDYRGKGLFELMYKLLIVECRKAGIVSVWGFTYAKKPFLRIGFQMPFDTMSGVYVISPFHAYMYLSSLNPNNQFKERFLIGGLTLGSFFKGIINPTKFCKNVFSGTFSYNKELEQSLVRTEKISIINESEDYLQWRILQNPYPNNYVELVIKNTEGQVTGSLIYNIRKEKIAFIEQLLFDPALKEGAKLMIIQHAIKTIRNSRRAHTIRFWAFPGNKVNRKEVELLEKCGFFFTKKGTGFVYLQLHENAPKAEDLLLSRLYTQGNI